MMDSYFKTICNTKTYQPDNSEVNLAKILRTFWNIRSLSKLQTIVIGLGLIVYNNQVLIGARKNKDKWVENLSWVFPGGKMYSLDFEEELVKAIYKETKIKVKVNSLVTARVHPDSGFKKIQIVALYFYCSPLRKTNLSKPGGDLAELKWIRPTDVFKYFTTSTCDEVTRFLMTIEKSSYK